MTKKKIINYSLLTVLVLTLIYAFVTLDYSNLSNLQLNNIMHIFSGLLQPDLSYVYDGTREDLVHLMLQTVVIAFYGTVIGSVFSLPFILLSAKSIWRRFQLIPAITRTLLNLLRAIPALIYAILFVRIVGPGPFAGALALGLQLIGMLGKLVGEELDRVDETPVEAMIAAGSSNMQSFQYARLPQVVPIAASHILNHFEINVRSATTLGLVGAGGIGAPIIFALQQRNWARVSVILLAIIVVVVIIDLLSSAIRSRLR
ncbi:phosphonate ABC transporter, permease protein PhnE [Aerococcaceae bacterium WGS1372]